LLGEAAQLGAQTVVFSGGEPLRVNYLVDVVQAASKLGLIPTIYTSGIRDDNLTPMSCDLAQRLRQAGLSRFIVILY
jgi:MoaA/NifB/PqqE/SkfB family radical SAM enzyme